MKDNAILKKTNQSASRVEITIYMWITSNQRKGYMMIIAHYLVHS